MRPFYDRYMRRNLKVLRSRRFEATFGRQRQVKAVSCSPVAAGQKLKKEREVSHEDKRRV